MSHHYDEKCPDCRPAMIDQNTGERIPNDHPMMKAVLSVYDVASLEERRALHKLWVDSDMSEENMAVAGPVITRIQDAVAKLN